MFPRKGIFFTLLPSPSLPLFLYYSLTFLLSFSTTLLISFSSSLSLCIYLSLSHTHTYTHTHTHTHSLALSVSLFLGNIMHRGLSLISLDEWMFCDSNNLSSSSLFIAKDTTTSKALRNWKIFFKALSKRIRKLMIKTKWLWRLKYFSFVNVND